MIIGLLASKGGVGRTTLARSLAEAATNERKSKCSLYEMDICNPKILSFYDWSGEQVTRKVSKVLHDKCKMVGKCLEACKFGAILKIDDKIGRRTGICRGCGLCRESCPEGAIDWDEKPAGEIGKVEQGDLAVIGGRIAKDDYWEGFLLKKIQDEYPLEPDMDAVIKAPLGLGATAMRAVKLVEAMVLVTTSHPGLEEEISTFGQILQGFGGPGGVVYQGSEAPQSLKEQCDNWGLECLVLPKLEGLEKETLQQRDPALAKELNKIWELGGGA
ncbi:MAG: hypothetical protein GXO58_10750 [Thermodesulfobacteria bacterium]|nr:hypothetical protein [Thermodesulfobacteriota bacterium]